jgi:CheY-like chemotaxis protein
MRIIRAVASEDVAYALGPIGTASAPPLRVTSVILLVDGNADTREMYGWLLGAEPDWRVVAAANTAQAVELTRARTPDVVVRDLSFTEAIGETGVCDNMRRFYGSTVPVVAIIGVPPQTVRDRKGYACVLQKPVLRDDLVVSIRRVMNQNRACY